MVEFRKERHLLKQCLSVYHTALAPFSKGYKLEVSNGSFREAASGKLFTVEFACFKTKAKALRLIDNCGDSVEIRKFLESERFASAQSMILTPRALSTEAEPNLAKATDDRLLMFNQDATPIYLRTKLDPQVEALRVAVDARALSLRTSPAVSPEHALVLHEKLVATLLDDVRLLKQEMDQDQEKLVTVRSAANQDDLFSLVATMTVGRDYAMRMKPDGSK
ncbi:Mediator of RNA polymerase II transcription subunit 8 [Taenia crassiceps]|uniref:Mediator of RNA polymerase II transcription subunit 8 n=1 Tax=Taenia crassiceps TaxID=6207 RepID=A0ABR4QR27_9CEST